MVKVSIMKASFLILLLLAMIGVFWVAETPGANAADTYLITASADSHSTISPSGTISVTQGSSRAFTFSASTGYTISRVLVNGSAVSTTSPYTFVNIQANHTISVSSTINTYYITSSADENSTITPSGVVSVTYGGSQTFSYSAKAGRTISSVLVDGRSTSITGSYTFGNVNANHTIAVASSESTPSPTPTPTPTPGPNSTASPTPKPTTSPSPTPTPTPTPPPTPTPTPTPELTPSPTSEPTPAPAAQPTQSQSSSSSSSSSQTSSPTNPPTVPATPKPTPKPTAAPTQSAAVEKPPPTPTANPNIISQNDAYPAGIAVVIAAVAIGAVVIIKKKQPYEERYEIQI